MTLGIAVAEQGQPTYDSALLTLHFKNPTKPFQLGTHQVGKLCASFLQSRFSKATYNKFPLGTICDVQLALGLAHKCHQQFPLLCFIPSTPISGSKKRQPELLVPKHPMRK